jgi:thymidylate synthase
MSGSSNIKDLHPSVHKWWKPWADENGEISNNYSHQLRRFDGVDKGQLPSGLSTPVPYEFDQVAHLMNAIKNHPYGRRSVITTWNPADMAHSMTPITNCHGTTIQAFVDPDNSLHLTMYQRSSDMVLGMQHNWVQYWAFLIYLANHCGRDVGSFTWIGGDCHIYEVHYDAAKNICDTASGHVQTPQLVYTPTSDQFLADDFTLSADYKPLIKKSLPMVV